MYKREKPLERLMIKVSKIVKNRMQRKIAEIEKNKSENFQKRQIELKEKKEKEIEDKKRTELEERKFKHNVPVGDQIWKWLRL